MEHMRNIKLILEYDGTNYSGWQWQDNAPTLQGALEKAIHRITGEALRVSASGRTDAGVHAYGQVVNFRTGSGLDIDKWRGALNHYLPADMKVLQVEGAPDEFDARRSARGKRYEYIVLNRYVSSPLTRTRAWHVAVPLDVDAMRRAGEALIGECDFSSFRGAGCSAKSPVRELTGLDIVRDGDRIVFTLKAYAFLRHMVRNIVGTLVEVGRGRLTPEDVAVILDARDRTKAGLTAPPQGLYMVEVEY